MLKERKGAEDGIPEMPYLAQLSRPAGSLAPGCTVTALQAHPFWLAGNTGICSGKRGQP